MAISETLSNISSNVLNVLTLVMIIVLLGGAMIAFYYFWKKNKQYSEYTCVIFERDGLGQVSTKTDKAGIFVDPKTKNKRLYLKEHKVGLSPDNIPFIWDDSGKKFVYLLRLGLMNFHYINMKVSNPDVYLSVGEEDVNWALDAFERANATFMQHKLMQLMPYIALAFTGIIICIIFIYFFKNFGVLRDLGVSLKEAAVALQQAKSGTLVLPGGS